MADIKPFTIAIPDEAIQDLKARLSLAKFPKTSSTAPAGTTAPRCPP